MCALSKLETLTQLLQLYIICSIVTLHSKNFIGRTITANKNTHTDARQNVKTSLTT